MSEVSNRAQIVAALLSRLRMPTPPPAASGPRVFNPALAAALALDPAATALLPTMLLPMALDSRTDTLFRVTSGGTLLVTPALLSCPALLGLVVRLAQEAAYLLRAGPNPHALASAARHGACLINRLEPPLRAKLRGWMFTDLWCDEVLASDLLVSRWLAAAFGVAPPDSAVRRDERACELSLPVEELLEAGGDARIKTSPETGLNRYGAASCPRPEAVHFSSSTASSVSDYVFAALDLLRRAWLVELLAGAVTEPSAIEVLGDAIAAELLRLHGLTTEEADVVLAPSGTDAELAAVLISLGAGGPLLNIVVAPEETGRSVNVAAAGLYFQDGLQFPRGEKVWPRADITVASVSVRGADGHLLDRERIEAEIADATHAGLSAGRRVLLHVLLGSKTGVSAPSRLFLERLSAPEARIDVVADSCQGRFDRRVLGTRVRSGWLAQVSGSKFFTGPPFSGALIVPATLRSRREAIGGLLCEAQSFAGLMHWPLDWRSAFESAPAPISFGPLLRWAGALIEAALFAEVPLDLARLAFDKFCTELRRKLSACVHLAALDPLCLEDADELTGEFDNFAVRSILCFAPLIKDGAGGMRRLGAAESEQLFRRLNADLGAYFEGHEAAVARQPMHLGQPVDLTPGSDPPNVILRLVVGARFFSTIAMAGAQWQAALDAEIADALRALAKTELILARWSQLLL